MATSWTRLAKADRAESSIDESFLSPDGFWILNIFICVHPFRLDAQLELTSDGERFIGSEYLNTTLDARRFFYPKRRNIDLTPILRMNRRSGEDIAIIRSLAKPLIESAKLWASQATDRITTKILTGNSNFSKASRETLNHLLENGSGPERAKATNYILLYLDRLNGRVSSKSDSKRNSAAGELGKFLNIYQSFRERLPNELSVMADYLESRGIVKSNPGRRISATDQIHKCQNFWTQYYNKPTKKNLKAVFAHLDKMKSSKSEKVKKERARCLRSANRESKRLKLK